MGPLRRASFSFLRAWLCAFYGVFYAAPTVVRFFSTRLVRSMRLRPPPRLCFQERNHVIVCLLAGAASTAIPLYDMSRAGDDPLAEW